tara:strand:- start:505 stop:711 length:207 start_codon:yes stop_codon:yes gene_type:complete
MGSRQKIKVIIMTWKDLMKEDKIFSFNMNSPENRDLKNEAMNRILQKVYSAPELELLIIEMMNRISGK